MSVLLEYIDNFCLYTYALLALVVLFYLRSNAIRIPIICMLAAEARITKRWGLLFIFTF